MSVPKVQNVDHSAWFEEMAYKLQLKLELRNYPRGGQREHDLIREALEDVYNHAHANSKVVLREWARAHLGTMAVSSVRQALRQEPFISGFTCQAILWCINDLEEKTLQIMVRDILQTKAAFGTISQYGDDRDWNELLKRLEDRLQYLECES